MFFGKKNVFLFFTLGQSYRENGVVGGIGKVLLMFSFQVQFT